MRKDEIIFIIFFFNVETWGCIRFCKKKKSDY